MKYHIWTEGCQMNVADSQRVASALEKLGYRATRDAESADVIVLNTCVVRQRAEDKAYARLMSLKPLKAARPDLVLALMGCLVGVRDASPLQKRFPFVDVFLPPSDPTRLVELLRARNVVANDTKHSPASDVAIASAQNPCPALPSDDYAIEQRERATRYELQDADLVLPLAERGHVVSAYIPIIYGCNHVCTFCIIPYRRGRERSRSIGEIVAEARALVRQGVKEITLLGQIVDRYGYDVGDDPRLPDLLRILNDLEGLERIRFLTSHPLYLTDELLEAVATLPKVCEHIEVPVQSGDDAMLEKMKRGYTVAEYRALIAKIRARIPHVSIATDIIVGMPGETKAQFRATYDLLAELQFDMVHVAMFSPRPNTVAARWDDDVPPDEKEHRRKAIDTLQAEIVGKRNAQYLGHSVEVLVEEKAKHRWKGRTRTNKLVFFEDDTHDWRGKLARVKIDWTGPWSMIGRVE